MRLLVIGGSGFLGCNFIRYVLEHYRPEFITNVDAGVHAGNHENLHGVAEAYPERYEFFPVDITNPVAADDIFSRHKYFALLHFASAETDGAVATLLASASKHRIKRFVYLTTTERPVEEALILQAFDPGGLEPIILRAAGVFGPNQWALATLPTWIRRILEGISPTAEFPVNQAREWLHADDFCSAVISAMLDAKPRSVFDVGPNEALPDALVEEWISQNIRGENRPDHVAKALPPTTDSSRIRTALDWAPIVSPEDGIRDVVRWYLHFRARLIP